MKNNKRRNTSFSDSEKLYEEYRTMIEKGNFLRQGYFEINKNEYSKGLLKFPTTEIQVGDDVCLLYSIPIEQLQDVLNQINPLKEFVSLPVNSCCSVPTLGDHNEYYFRDAKIIFYNGYNYIVPPMFFECGATAKGWFVVL